MAAGEENGDRIKDTGDRRDAHISCAQNRERPSVPGFQSSDFLPADLLRDNSAPSSDENPTDSFQEPHRSRPDIPAQFRRLALYRRDFRTNRRSACLRVCSVRGASEVIKHGKGPLSAGCAFHCKDHSAKFVTYGCVSRAVKTTGRVECNGAPGIPTGPCRS
jgi:hypothetical protein